MWPVAARKSDCAKREKKRKTVTKSDVLEGTKRGTQAYFGPGKYAGRSP